jgi:thioester reductase-like protein
MQPGGYFEIMTAGNSRILSYRNIFVTGATGVLGARLVKEILASTTSQIYCLVRAESLEQGRDRLLALHRVYDPEGHYLDEFQKRVKPVLGDVVSPQFGLSDVVYRELCDKIDVTFHAAAYTNLFANYRRIEPINVGGVKNVIQFCLNTVQKCLSYVSTYTVMGDKVFDPNLTFRETDLDVGQNFEYMTYQHTKFIGENLIRGATDQGLLWTIMRPGQIFGESQTGRYPQGQTNVSGLFYDIFKTIIETKVAFSGRTHYDVTPVDYVSKAILYLGAQHGEFHKTYHLTNPDIKTYHDVVAVVKTLGYEINQIPQDEYKKLLYSGEILKDGLPYSSITTKALKWWWRRDHFDFDAGAITDSTMTCDVLLSAGITCPKIDQNLLGTYIEAGIRESYFPAPQGFGRGQSVRAASAGRSTWAELPIVEQNLVPG